MDVTSPWGETLVRWTVRLAVGCYVARSLLDIANSTCTTRGERIARALWTGGCVLFLLHVGCAFHFAHRWSHAAAYEHTVGRTAAVTGLAWGGGLYVNYAFAALWMTDVALWWSRRPWFRERAAPESVPGTQSRDPRWGRWWNRGVQAVFAFMMFNATIVFGPPFWRGVGGAVVAALALAAIARCRRSRAS